jgi:hypothetical protein
MAFRPDVEKGRGRFCSTVCVGRWRSADASTGYSRGKGGRRADLDNRYFRSRWEANWARYLNLLVAQGVIARWEYEVDTFEFEGIKRGSRFYTPDFKVHYGDGSFVYHEVKGWMDPRSKTKLDRMKRRFPQVAIEIVDQARYRAIRETAAGLIPNWEA